MPLSTAVSGSKARLVHSTRSTRHRDDARSGLSWRGRLTPPGHNVDCGGGREEETGTVPRGRAKGCTVGPVAPPISYVSHGLNCAIEKFAVTVLMGAGVKVPKRAGFRFVGWGWVWGQVGGGWAWYRKSDGAFSRGSTRTYRATRTRATVTTDHSHTYTDTRTTLYSSRAPPLQIALLLYYCRWLYTPAYCMTNSSIINSPHA